MENKIVILTALPVEYSAVRQHLNNIEEVEYKGSIYEKGEFAGKNKDWQVLIAEAGAGNQNAAFETERAITFFEPKIAFFIGIAGGLKDAEVGDIVVGTKIYGYESGKVEETFKVRPNVGESSYSLIQKAKATARNTKWYSRIPSRRESDNPKIYHGAIAAGEKVIASTEAEIYKFLKQNYNDALAIEMEGRGFLAALHANESVQSIVLRGISDLLNNKSDSSDSNRQKTASNHVSAFAFEMLSNLV